MGKGEGKIHPEVCRAQPGARHISASPFPRPAMARGFNASRRITNHLICGFGFAEASPLPASLALPLWPRAA